MVSFLTESAQALKAQVYSFGSSVYQISEDKTIASRLKICEDWDLSIDLKLPVQNTDEWINVFGLTIENPSEWLTEPFGIWSGSNIPAVWIQPKSENPGLKLKLSVGYTPIGSRYYRHDDPTERDWDSWINLKVSQTSGMFEVKINNVIVDSISNSNPQDWNDVKIVMGNTYGASGYGSYRSAVGEYRNFEIRSCSSIVF